MIKERDIEAYLKKRVKEAGGEYRRVQWQGRRGAPDDFVILNGGHWTECKAPGKKPEPHQTREHARMLKHGVPVTIIDSFEAVDEFIKAVTYGC